MIVSVLVDDGTVCLNRILRENAAFNQEKAYSSYRKNT